MSETLATSLVWGAGLLTQALLLLGLPLEKGEGKLLCYIVAASLFGFLPGKHETVYEPHIHIFISFCIFVLIFSLIFKSKLMNAVNEYIVMMCTLLFLYVSFITFHTNWPFFVSCAPAIIVLLFLFEAWTPQFKAKAFLYVWYLMTITVVGLAIFHLDILSPFFDELHSVTLPPAVAFLSGMAFLSVGIHIVYLFELIPIPGKHETLKHRMEKWREDVQLMASRFSGQQERFSVLLSSALFCTVLLVINILWHPISNLLAINMILVGMPYIHGAFGSQPQNTTSALQPQSVPPASSSAPVRTSKRRSR